MWNFLAIFLKINALAATLCEIWGKIYERKQTARESIHSK
jgi:hypothetical protein